MSAAELQARLEKLKRYDYNHLIERMEADPEGDWINYEELLAALSVAAPTGENGREQLRQAAEHWPIGELGTLPDFRCSCGATLLGVDSKERIAAWKKHICELPLSPQASGRTEYEDE
jgi:hypothetical protein